MRLINRLFKKTYPKLSVEQANALIKQGAVIIDVRTKAEFSRSHAPGALNFPLNTLNENMAQLPKGKLILHCHSGLRAHMALKKIKTAGRDDVFNLGSLSKALQLKEP